MNRSKFNRNHMKWQRYISRLFKLGSDYSSVAYEKLYRQLVTHERRINVHFKSIYHDPEWVPTQLRYNLEGDTKPGFECVHEMENGNGQCGANIFELDDAISRHSCGVLTKKGRNRRNKQLRKKV